MQNCRKCNYVRSGKCFRKIELSFVHTGIGYRRHDIWNQVKLQTEENWKHGFLFSRFTCLFANVTFMRYVHKVVSVLCDKQHPYHLAITNIPRRISKNGFSFGKLVGMRALSASQLKNTPFIGIRCRERCRR